MEHAVSTTHRVSENIADVFSDIFELETTLIDELNSEITHTFKSVGYALYSQIVDLLDSIFDLYSYEWTYVNDVLSNLNVLFSKTVLREVEAIDRLLRSFQSSVDAVLKKFVSGLENIETGIDRLYNDRIFKIYGYLAELSRAINAPPDYLEMIIMSARAFALSAAFNYGVSYEQFQADWADGLHNLFTRIAGNIEFYRKNPQHIKVDLEENLIKPVFAIGRKYVLRQKEQLSKLDNDVIELRQTISSYKTIQDENTQAINNIFESEVKPALQEITDSFENWKDDVFSEHKDYVRKSLMTLYKSIVTNSIRTENINNLLDYGGDLLLRIDKLSDFIRIEQETKITDVAARQQARDFEALTGEIKKDKITLDDIRKTIEFE